MSVKEQLMQHATSTKAAIITGTTTTGVGAGTWFDVIPDDIGKIVSLVGLFSTCVVMFFHLRKSALEIKKTQLEIDLIKAEAARLQAAEDD